MLTEFIYQWNPLNIYGVEVGVEDLIRHPLQPNETLMQDGHGHCRRIYVPPQNSPLFERVIFWLQTHLNKKGHLAAIENLIALFYQHLLQNPPQKTENLQEFHLHVRQISSLKNDYFFVHDPQGDPSFIDSRLKEMEQHAYSIFTFYHKQQALEQEELRKQAFIQFQEQVEEKLEELAEEYRFGLMRGRLLIIAPSDILRALFEERVESLDRRIEAIEALHQQLLEMETLLKGKFTIPLLEETLIDIKRRLCQEVYKVQVEAELMIRHLILNYRLTLSKEESKILLDSIQVDPEKNRGEFPSCPALLFEESLESEIEKMKKIFQKE
jgi:hypothetical protein